ncbi:MAG: hypothetical protein SFW67_06320 [Myxococcaceae bacterium]|nr:hypothetical protein [Myxococcaceae bacterium]
MLTPHTLVLVLSQVSMLGEAGESCRTDADCAAPFACVRAVCTVRPAPVAPATRGWQPAPTPVPVTQPAPGWQSAPAAVGAPTPAPSPATDSVPPPLPARSTAPDEVAHVAAEPEAAPPGQFSGVHFAIGVQGGAGPAFVRAGSLAYSQGFTGFAGAANFEGQAMYVPVELRLALLIGRFELALEGAPLSTTIIGVSARSLAPLSVSVGGLFKLYEQGPVGVYLPLRARAGLIPTFSNFGFFGGGSVGVGVRFERVLFEVKGGAEYLLWNLSSAVLVPFTAGATIAF